MSVVRIMRRRARNGSGTNSRRQKLTNSGMEKDNSLLALCVPVDII
jgi:hypothetical protein